MMDIEQLLKRGVAKTGLAPLLYRAYGWIRSFSLRRMLANRRLRQQGAPDKLPIPPDYLIFLTSGTRDVGWFLRSGRAAADSIQQVMERNGPNVEQFDRILDFGCGCGRVLRHWHDLNAVEMHGCDYNRALVRWTSENLPFANVTTNEIAPPLPYGPDSFELVYALSVFTHLTESLQHEWMEELHRVIRDLGYLIISTHGDRHATNLTSLEKDRYHAGQLVVRDDLFVGSNICAAYHPEQYVREELSRGFEVVAFLPEGAKGNPRQDLYLLQKS